MTIVEFRLADGSPLDLVDMQIKQYLEAGIEPKFILVGPDAFEALCREISIRFRRGKGHFDTYNHVPIVVDPFRAESFCVVPDGKEILDGVETYRTNKS